MSNTILEKVKVYRIHTPQSECPWGMKVIKLLQEQEITFEDHKLHSTQEIEAFKVKYNVATTPQIFVGMVRIGGYTDLAAKLNVNPEIIKKSTQKNTYTPVIAIFSTTGLMTLATSMGLTGFMGFSLSLLATLKLMDLESFVQGFEEYDLVTKKIKLYGKIYPFVELAIALGFLSGFAPLATGLASLGIGVSGGISIVKSIYIDKSNLNCACVGGNSRTPLGVVSFAENVIMAVMGTIFILTAVTDNPELIQMKDIDSNKIVKLQYLRK